ncbi:hypothetical protein [Streptomyces nigrescens]|uniref:hypothetical protein n=1 Tax=Streptomyces nigrescens TaxID=1920 RepID=UPI00225BC6EC|nr:hypothetical protein [Streptomyces libani]MCX5446016.1 hypothetical protein [Streptomyces libani]
MQLSVLGELIHCMVDFLGEFASFGYGQLPDGDYVIGAPDVAIVARLFDIDIRKVDTKAPECSYERTAIIFGLFSIGVRPVFAADRS